MQALRSKTLWIFLILLGLARLVSLSAYPLMDPTEARYGEIARIITETGDWVVPRIDYDLPFWGKPPLSFWASAASIEGFTNSEFFLRLPHFLAALLVLLVIWQFAVALGLGRRQADYSLAVVATTFGFLITAGTIMTDMLLCLAMTLVMVGFWRGWHGNSRYLYLMYAGLGIGLLDKGPVILALAALALLPWIAIECGLRRMWGEMFARLNIFRGLLLTLAIAAPWYFLMERASPGFLQYFVVGEHLQRFIDSGWHGDLYGSGHARVRGTIWIYWFLFAFPWSLLLVIAAYRYVVAARKSVPRDPLILFLVLWMCSPMLLFTLAGNVLPAYIVPGLPAVGLLMLKSFRQDSLARGRLLLGVGPLAVLLLCLDLTAFGLADQYSDKALLGAGLDPGRELFYLGDRPYSAQYYSGGRAREIEALPDRGRFYLVVSADRSVDGIDEYCRILRSSPKRRLYDCQRDAAQ